MSGDSTPFEYVGEYVEHKVVWNERNQKNSIKVKAEGRGPDLHGPTKTRTISLWQTDKDGNDQPWLQDVLGAQFLQPGDPRRVLVFKGFSSVGAAPDGGTNTYWNGTKVEAYDPETYRPGSARQPVGSTESAPPGAGSSGAGSPSVGQERPSYVAMTPRDEARWAVDRVVEAHGLPSAEDQAKAANVALGLLALVDLVAQRRRDAQA